MNINLSVGDLVTLSPDTRMDTNEPYNPLGVVGRVTDVSSNSIHVFWGADHWDGDVWYDPQDSDLILVHNFLYKTRTEARTKATELGFVVVDLGKDSQFRWGITVKEI